MMFPMHFAQALASDVRVNFRGADAGVAEEFLNHAEVRAVFEEVRGEAVTHHVRRDVAVEARAPHAVRDALPHGDVRECGAASREEDGGRGFGPNQLRARDGEVAVQGAGRWRRRVRARPGRRGRRAWAWRGV